MTKSKKSTKSKSPNETHWKCGDCGWKGNTHQLAPVTLCCPECRSFNGIKLDKKK